MSEVENKFLHLRFGQWANVVGVSFQTLRAIQSKSKVERLIELVSMGHRISGR